MSSYPGQGLPWLVSNEGFPGEDFSNDNVSAVSAGGTHACLVQQGNAWCLGSNYTGQVGHGSVGNNAEPLAPVVARPGDSSRLSGVTAINAGESQGGNPINALILAPSQVNHLMRRRTAGEIIPPGN